MPNDIELELPHHRYNRACEVEFTRLRIAESWARANLSAKVARFNRGLADRQAGNPCRSADGDYLNGWHAIKTLWNGGGDVSQA